MVRYSVFFFNWIRKKLRNIENRTDDSAQGPHPRNDGDRLYITRKEGGSGLVTIGNGVDMASQGLQDKPQKCIRPYPTKVGSRMFDNVQNI